MAALAILVALMIGPFQGAPVDVPKNHWAHDAVNTLFKEGLLKGYPAEKELKLNEQAKMTLQDAITLRKRWRNIDVLTDLYVPCRGGELSRYDLAFDIYTAWTNVSETLKTRSNVWDTEIALGELWKVANSVSAFRVELTKLGANPKGMIDTLNHLRKDLNCPFRG